MYWAEDSPLALELLASDPSMLGVFDIVRRTSVMESMTEKSGVYIDSHIACSGKPSGPSRS
jgi:hypothetical protein